MILPIVFLVLALLAVQALRVRSRQELGAQVLELLGALVRRGAPLVPAISGAAEEHRGRDRKALRQLAARIDSGAPLGEALADCRHLALPSHAVAAVRGAEGTNGVADALDGAAADCGIAREHQHRVWIALAYPTWLAIFLGVVAVTLVGPMIERIGEGSDHIDLDHPAMVASRAGGRVGLYLAVTLAAATVLTVLLHRQNTPPDSRRGLRRALWRTLPLGWAPARLAGTSRLLRALAAHVRAGTSLDISMSRAAGAAGHAGVEKAARGAAQGLAGGAAADEVWTALPLPGSAVARLGAAARRDAAALAAMLSNVADDLAQRERDLVDARIRWLQPVSIFIVAALLATQLAGLVTVLGAVHKDVGLW